VKVRSIRFHQAWGRCVFLSLLFGWARAVADYCECLLGNISLGFVGGKFDLFWAHAAGQSEEVFRLCVLGMPLVTLPLTLPGPGGMLIPGESAGLPAFDGAADCHTKTRRRRMQGRET